MTAVCSTSGMPFCTLAELVYVIPLGFMKPPGKIFCSRAAFTAIALIFAMDPDTMVAL